MRKLVVIDLTSADLGLFEAYERKVLPLLDKYGAQLELSVRTLDETTETHVLCFPDEARFEAFLSDPSRTAMRDDWKLLGATATITDVETVHYR